MNTSFEPVDGTSQSTSLSEVTELSLGASGLRVVVLLSSRDNEDDEFVEVVFPYHRGHRYLDEGDLLPYWRSLEAGKRGYVVYEVKNGGWMKQEIQTPGMLTTTDAAGLYREWFIATSMGCLNVISKEPPLVRRFR